LRVRTKITAWVVIVMGSMAVIMPSKHMGSEAVHLFLIGCCFAAVVLWAAVLMRQRWARKALLAVIAVQFLSGIYSATGTPAAHHKGAAAFWVLLLCMGIAIYGWQALALLTDDPANWSIQAQGK